ncbi:AlbA family DNA-binding domain-containing protein [Desulfatirhabdium butyrativorans]|uniref:AlbA family DNA-binding domain-containing protein n=1 Tax=Desulfatirhabdium butyrativorans TaxID=340467 RepID=UPI0012EB5645|nr:helix-turn-helix domain-containing protein [Desulfatirhabdium butyrativorans]
MTIETLLKQPEGKTLEFKRDLSSPKKLMKTLVAFANTAGGKVIIGVDDKNRSPVGIAHPLDEEERLCSMIADAISPRLVPNVEMVTVENKTLLVIEVFLSGTRPHWVKAEGPETGVYVRLGSTNRQADRELIAELRRSVEGIAFDELPMPDLTVADLDLAAMKTVFRGRHNLDEKEMLTLRLLTKDQGRLVPTKGAVLICGKERSLHFPDAWVQCGRFIGRDKARIFDHIDLYDHLPQAVDGILLFLKKHAMRGADFSEVRRKDVWSIPLEILREVVINALVHADYSQRGAPIRVAFFDDRIEIENPGILLPGMTIEDMRRGVSKIRNHVIARIFRELNLIEQWGSGIPRILREAEALGLPDLQMEEIGMRVRVTVFLVEQIAATKSAEQVEAHDEAHDEAHEPMTEVEQVIMTACAHSPQSTPDLLRMLGYKSRTGNFKRALSRLLAMGLLEMTNPQKPRARNQRYRSTHSGEEVLRKAGQDKESTQ